MHFILTEDFLETYNRFIEYCDEHSINASSAIRKAIEKWLEDKKKETEQLEKLKKSEYWKNKKRR